MNGKELRVIGALVGDIVHEPGAKTKYGQLFELIGQQLDLVSVFDASLKGSDKWLRALKTMHPNRRLWREKYYHNSGAFRTRSERAAAYLISRQNDFDVVLQVGVLFDAYADQVPVPHVIYTDYTMALSARKPDSGRTPMSRKDRNQWMALERKAYEHAAHICTRGQFVRDSIINDYGIGSDRVTAIGGGVNFKSLPEKTITPHHSPTALFIGKDFHRKGGDILLQAFEQVRTQVCDAQLLLLTADPVTPGLPLDGVEIITPTWDRTEIARLYQRADVFVLPSRLETWGDVLLEAMAYGLPCIGVTGDAMEEIIEHGQAGLIIPPNNTIALAEALTELLQNKSRRQEMGYASRNKVEACYRWTGIVDRLVQILGEVDKKKLKVVDYKYSG